MAWQARFILGIMTFAVAGEPDQPEPSPSAFTAPPAGAVPLRTQNEDSEQAPPNAPPATDDVEKLLLLLAAAASGALGAQLFPRWRGAPRRPHQRRFEDRAMTNPEPTPHHEPDRHEHQPVVRGEPAAPPPTTGATVVETVPEIAEERVAPPTEVSAPVARVETADVAPAAAILSVEPPAASPLPPGVSESAGVVSTSTPSTADALRETRASHSHQSWGSFNRDALPRLLFYGGNKFCQFSADKLHAADEWFVIGDIHGDFYALHTIVSHVRKLCPQFGIIFLGDLIDRGPHPIECLWYLLKLADDHPERVLWLAGNHDVGARYDEATGEFRSTVEPAEFVSDLNVVDSFSPLRRAFGREYIELAEGLPRAALMPDGLLLTHGGFPHTDLQAELAAMTLKSDQRKWLESAAVIRDFTHLRITRYPLRIPNRLSISCSYGYQDFATFKQSMAGYGIKRLVTGHQHAAAGFDDHREWAKHGHEALTLTGFGFADAYDRPDSYGINYRRTLTVGRCRPDQIPEVVTIPVREQDLMAFCDAEIKTMKRFAVS